MSMMRVKNPFKQIKFSLKLKIICILFLIILCHHSPVHGITCAPTVSNSLAITSQQDTFIINKISVALQEQHIHSHMEQ